MTSSAPEPSPTELLAAAVAEARRGRDEGGVPIGAALVVDGQVIAVEHTTGGCRRAAPSSTARPTASGAAAPCRLGLRAGHDGDHAVAVRHAHRRDPAVQDPAGDHRREPHVPGRGGAAPLARGGGRRGRRRVHRADGGSSPASPPCGTRTSASDPRQRRALLPAVDELDRRGVDVLGVGGLRKCWPPSTTRSSAAVLLTKA